MWVVVFGEDSGEWAAKGPYLSHESAWDAACEDCRDDGRIVALEPSDWLQDMRSADQTS